MAVSSRAFEVAILVVVILGSFAYSVSAYATLPEAILSSLNLETITSVVNGPSGINGSIRYDRGAVSCSIPFPDPQGGVLVQGSNGKIMQVSVIWTSSNCDLKTGVFQILVHPGRYHVSFTGYPLTLPPNGAIGGTNLPLNVFVHPHQLTQIRIAIDYGI